jgi:hypothetical protein
LGDTILQHLIMQKERSLGSNAQRQSGRGHAAANHHCSAISLANNYLAN